MSAPAIGSYLPLRGDELKKYVIYEFSEMLGDYPAWSAAIAHINPRIKITLHVKTFPYDPGRELTLEKSLRKQTHESDPPVSDPHIPLVNKTIEHEETVEDADKARADAGLAVPHKQETSDGQISDYAESPFGEFDPGQGGPKAPDSSAEGSGS